MNLLFGAKMQNYSILLPSSPHLAGIEKLECIMINKINGLALVTAIAMSGVHCTEKKCSYKPAPIFEQGLPHIEQYNYEVQGQESMESMLLDTKTMLEIYQNVCESSFQEYKFTVKGDFKTFPDSLWIREASRQLVFLSTLSPKQRSLKDWADIIELRRSDMRLGEKREVQPGIYVTVDKVLSPDQGQLLVTFSQEAEK